MKPQKSPLPLRLAACLALVLTLLAARPAPRPALGALQLPSPTPTPALARVDTPLGGEALQGVVTIAGLTAVSGFRSADISFAYQSDPTGTWFLIQQASAGVADGPLAAWDTTTISDGDYRLRLQVFVDDGPAQVVTVEGLRVRNYLPVETSTPGALPVERPTATPSPTPLPDYRPGALTAAPRPTNPAEITPARLGQSAITGGLAASGLLLAMLLFVAGRGIFRR